MTVVIFTTVKNESTYKRNAVLFAIGLNIFLVSAKLVGWYFGASSALFSDALDSLTDLFGDLIILGAVWLSARPPDERHHFGHLKAESIVTVIAGLLIVGLAISTIVRGTESLLSKSVSAPQKWTAGVAFVSILLCVLGWRVLECWARRTHSSALKSGSAHKLADAGTSAAALLGILSSVYCGFKYGDAIASVVVALWVMRTGLKIVFMGGSELMDSAPEAKISADIERTILSVPGVDNIRSLRTRTAGGKVFVDAEVDVAPDLPVVDGHMVAHLVQDEIERLSFVAGAQVHIGPSENAADVRKFVESEIEKVCDLIPDVIGFHGIGVFHTNQGLLAVVDIIVHPDMTVKEAHRVAEMVRGDILARAANVVDAIVHIDFQKDER